MSEQDKQSDQENPESTDSLTDDASTTDQTDISSELDGEENKLSELYDTDDGKQKEHAANKAKEQRDKQIETYSERYYNGDIPLAEVPKWIQKEINKADSPDKEADFDKKFEERMARRDDTNKYAELKLKLNDVAMTSEQRKALVSEYKDLKKVGVNPGKALDAAIKIAGIKFDKKDASVKNPVTSGKENISDEGKSYKEKTKNMTDDEKREYLQNLTGY